MIRQTLFYLLLCVGSAPLIIGCSQEQDPTSSQRVEKAVETTDGAETTDADQGASDKHPEASIPVNPQVGPPSWEIPKQFIGELQFPSTPRPSPESRELTKQDRIRDLYDSLTEADWEGLDPSGHHPKAVEILVEGMDAFTAAKYLNSLGSYWEYVDKYADQAVAENPGDFDVLLFRGETTHYQQAEKAEAVFRQLYEMKPDSIDVLYGLGSVLYDRKPDEAVVYLEKVVAMDASSMIAYVRLGISYRELGRWDEAIEAFQKAEKLDTTGFTQGAIEVVNELRKKAEARNRVGIETEDIPSEDAPKEGKR